MPFTIPKDNVARLGLKEGMVVADFGTGPGAYALAAGRRVGTSGKVYAIDIQKDILSSVRDAAEKENLKNIETIWADVEEKGGSGFRDSFADAVIISNLLFQSEDKNAIVREACRILKPSGRVLAVEWSDSFGNLGPAREAILDKDFVKDLFEKAGFNVIVEFETGDHHYGIVFEKS